MALDFSALKKGRGNFDSLMKEVEKIATPQAESNQKDDRFWQPEVDKAWYRDWETDRKSTRLNSSH